MVKKTELYICTPRPKLVIVEIKDKVSPHHIHNFALSTRESWDFRHTSIYEAGLGQNQKTKTSRRSGSARPGEIHQGPTASLVMVPMGRPWPAMGWFWCPVLSEADKHLFRCSATVTVGNDRTATFWESTWANGLAPRDFAPHLPLISNKKKYLWGGEAIIQSS